MGVRELRKRNFACEGASFGDSVFCACLLICTYLLFEGCTYVYKFEANFACEGAIGGGSADNAYSLISTRLLIASFAYNDAVATRRLTCEFCFAKHRRRAVTIFFYSEKK